MKENQKRKSSSRLLQNMKEGEKKREMHDHGGLTLDGANEDHGEVSIGEDLGGVCHSIIDLLHPKTQHHISPLFPPETSPKR